MNYSKPQVVWEKWRDPYSFEEPHDDYYLPEELQSEYDEAYGENSFDELAQGSQLFPNKDIKILMTSFGVIPIPEHADPNNTFNFWTGHTNFEITKSISKAIEGVTGVETLEVYTRYRFRIGIGKLFKDSEVMVSIQDEIQGNVSNG